MGMLTTDDDQKTPAEPYARFTCCVAMLLVVVTPLGRDVWTGVGAVYHRVRVTVILFWIPCGFAATKAEGDGGCCDTNGEGEGVGG